VTALTVEARDGDARCGWVATRHGRFQVPAFMPVGTHATVKAVHPAELRDCGIEILLCNAYHLALRPGVDLVERAGGLHRFMGWDGPILTDSGGYQLVSLGAIAAVEEDAVTFVSPYDGSRLRVSPEQAVGFQARLGADVIMCLDQPVPWGSTPEAVRTATERTQRWAERCRDAAPEDGTLLFGIAQGGFDATMRRESARAIAGLDFDGVAIGGLSVGEPPEVMLAMTAESLAELPSARPRYFMGLGTDAELIAMVAMGVDMFDCVVPTRLARNGSALTRDGVLSLRNSAAREDFRPIAEDCDCAACSGFSRAYLRHLFSAGEILAHRLVTIHNLAHLSRLMREARTAIREGRFAAFQGSVTSRLESKRLASAGPPVN
jgi:queuine tRNA-ribosyltransferase